jgi:hypothetical protein
MQRGPAIYYPDAEPARLVAAVFLGTPATLHAIVTDGERASALRNRSRQHPVRVHARVGASLMGSCWNGIILSSPSLPIVCPRDHAMPVDRPSVWSTIFLSPRLRRRADSSESAQNICTETFSGDLAQFTVTVKFAS